jgi:hypothetical protein
LPLNFAVGYAIREVLAKQDGLKLSGTYQLLLCAEDDYVLGKDVYITKVNAMLY